MIDAGSPESFSPVMKAFSLLLALGLPSPLLAATAHELFQTGAQALAAGKAAEALSAFEAAYAAQPSPSLLFWLGEAERASGHSVKAARYYRRYIKAEPNGTKKADALARLAERKAQTPMHRGLSLEELDLQGPAESSSKPEVSATRSRKSRKRGSGTKAEKTAPEGGPPLTLPAGQAEVAPPLTLPAGKAYDAKTSPPDSAETETEAREKVAAPSLPATPGKAPAEVPPATPLEPAPPIVTRPPLVTAPPVVAAPPAAKSPFAASKPPAALATPPPAASPTLIYIQYTGRLLSTNGSFMGNYATTTSPGASGTLYTHGLAVGAQTEHFKNGVYLGFGTEFGGAFGAGTDTLLRYELSWQCLWNPLGSEALLTPQIGFRLGGMGVKSERLTGGSLKPGVVVAVLGGLNLQISRWVSLSGGIGYDADLGPDLGPTASVSGYSVDFGGALRF